MKIGILVDGQSEFHGLRLLLPKIVTSAQLLSPIYCDIQPFATPAQIAYVVTKRIPILISRGVSKVVILLDKETRSECTPRLVNDLEGEIGRRLFSIKPAVNTHVVLKVSTFENWLVADPQAFPKHSGMFKDHERIRKYVEPNKADTVNAQDLLKRCSQGGDFDKVRIAKVLCESLDPDHAAQNSRSFRRLLRVLGHPLFSSQSRNPPS